MSSVAEKLQRKAPRKTSTKQVRLKLVYVDFWSVLKLAALLSICLGIVQVVFSVLVWVVLNSSQVFAKIDDLLRDVLNDPSFTITNEFSLATVATFALVVALLNVVIGTALGAIVAVLYNLAARITGGLLVGFQNN
ncbi:MAG: DUF3566 domain-containing protein [Burkholderiaceae bacterium]|nr:DUF3566 domain-containing protein [Microbacteriaceae bacterium]